VKNYNKIARQAGMTLIELTVVLLVLVGLAGLMMPYVGSFVGKTHDATGAQNANRSGEALVRYNTTHNGFPANLDSLLVGAGTATGALIDSTMNEAMANMGAGYADATARNTGLLAAYGWAPLNLADAGNVSVCGSIGKAGLGTVTDMVLAPANPTFDNAAAIASVDAVAVSMAGAVTCTGSVVEMTSAAVETAMGITADANKTYVVYGIGQLNAAVGKTMQDAPVHFAKNADMNASKAYNRFVAIFAADNTATAAADAGHATYVGTAMVMSSIVGAQKELANYYTEAAANN